jgi:hypothetical protein
MANEEVKWVKMLELMFLKISIETKLQQIF